jgi:hypothetical protein
MKRSLMRKEALSQLPSTSLSMPREKDYIGSYHDAPPPLALVIIGCGVVALTIIRCAQRSIAPDLIFQRTSQPIGPRRKWGFAGCPLPIDVCFCTRNYAFFTSVFHRQAFWVFTAMWTVLAAPLSFFLKRNPYPETACLCTAYLVIATIFWVSIIIPNRTHHNFTASRASPWPYLQQSAPPSFALPPD